MDELIIFKGFGHTMIEVLIALSPLFIVFIIFKFLFRIPIENLYQMFVGVVLTILGLGLFLHGVHIGFLPMGEIIGETLGESSYNWVLIPIGFILGFVATVAEPAVRILNYEVEKASTGSIKGTLLLYTLSIGVGIFVALAMMRILYGWPLWWIILPGYIIAFILTRFVSDRFVSIGFDAGGVATGPMTVIFILSLAVGVANVVEGRDPLVEGFGLVALVALAPVLAVLVLGLMYDYQSRINADDTNDM